MRTTMGRRAYPSDLSDEQWVLLEPLIPQPSTEGDGLRRLSGAKLSMASSTCCAVGVPGAIYLMIFPLGAPSITIFVVGSVKAFGITS